MKNKAGLSFMHERLESRSITDVELMVLQDAPEPRCLKMALAFAKIFLAASFMGRILAANYANHAN